MVFAAKQSSENDFSSKVEDEFILLYKLTGCEVNISLNIGLKYGFNIRSLSRAEGAYKQKV